MMDERALVESIFKTTLQGCDGNVKEQKHTLWLAACTLVAAVLRETDELNRERLLHGLVSELRASIDHLDELLRPPSPRSLSDWGRQVH
jgi:hypothetical protein